jgi:chemotaxis protein CheC
MPFRKLNDKQLDTLKEVGNIGMGHAATALSQMIGQAVHLEVPHASIVEISEVADYLGGAEQLMVGITLRVLGDARGNIMLLFSEESAHRLLCRLLGRCETGLVMDQESVSALKEVGNILTSAYLSALGNLLDKTLIPSVPLLAYDMAGAVVDHVLIDLSRSGDHVMMVETDFFGTSNQESAIRGHFFLFPDPSALDILLNGVRNPYE